jgi:predicted DNA-binding transcriptional regulator YafY
MRYKTTLRIFEILEIITLNRLTAEEIKKEYEKNKEQICNRTIARDLKFLEDNMYIFSELTQTGKRYKRNKAK